MLGVGLGEVCVGVGLGDVCVGVGLGDVCAGEGDGLLTGGTLGDVQGDGEAPVLLFAPDTPGLAVPDRPWAGLPDRCPVIAETPPFGLPFRLT